jgi:alkylation response protein AidB-like acyl-CoA dehydrogenase
MAQWCVLATCTDPEAPSDKRITLFLVPMDRAGIEVRPIPSMLGPHHLNEVFIDGLRVSRDDVLGEVGAGWAVMRDALAYERVGIARYARCESLMQRLLEVLDDDGRWESLAPALHARWVRALVDLRVARLLAYRAVGDSSGIDPAAAAVARIVTTTCDQTVAEVLVDAAGPGALDAGKDAILHGSIDDHWRYAQAATVASGTIEVQRMLVARSVLGSSR